MNAEDYWNQILTRLGATNETIADWQADLRLEPEFSEVMHFATPEQRAEYDYIYQTCLYNLMLQQECDQRKMELASAYRDGWCDRDLFGEKHYLESDMDDMIRTKAKKRVKAPTFIGIAPHLLGGGGYLFIMLIALTALFSGMSVSISNLEQAGTVTCVGGILFTVPVMILAIALIFSYYPIPDLIYCIVQSVFWAAVFVIYFLIPSTRAQFHLSFWSYTIGFPLFFTVIPLIYLIFSLRYMKRHDSLKRFKQDEKETYEEMLYRYSDVLNQLNENFGMQLNLIQADCEARKHHPTAVLYNNIPNYYGEFCKENEETYQTFSQVLESRKNRRK